MVREKRMSMISELLNRLEDLEQWEKTTDEPKARLIREAVDTIRELSEKLHAANMERSSRYYNGGWIKFTAEYGKAEKRRILTCPVPEDGQEVLVSLKSGYVDKDIFCCEGTDCYFDGGYEIVDEAVAWMSLPEPYREGKKE